MLDAIVVGAGLSGLVCAHRLAAANLRVAVLEARDRVGGRLHSVPFAGATIDLGGQWMAVGQPRLAALASALGVRSFPQRRDGHPLFALPERGFFARASAAVARWRGARKVQHLAKNPALALDAFSLADWLARSVRHPSARALLAMHAELVFAIDPASLSLLYYLRTFASTGGFAPLGPDLPGGGREHRFAGGAQSLALALAKHLDVRLASSVHAVTHSSAAVTVRTAASTFEARDVVLALPPALARSLAITPELPLPARQFLTASQVGAVVKCFAAYERPFWRDANLSGEAFRPHGDIRATVALEPPPDADAPSVLLAFVVGAAARAWHARPADERRALVLDTFVEQFGEAAATPLDYTEADWSIDPWSTGCVASLPPHALLDGAALRAPHGRIHFAGTETAALWPGYMEGAIEAGERAADEVLSGA
jgi:monoamine oxidase